MSTATTQGDAITNLRAQLAARAGLAAVTVRSGPALRADGPTTDAIELWETESDEDWRVLGNRRRVEKYRIHGGIYALRAGADEATIAGARAAAVGILNELHAQLAADVTLNGAVRVAALVRSRIDQDYTTDGRWCLIEFWVECEAHLNVS